jgi:iron-sulfur cluster assembly accessory protein
MTTISLSPFDQKAPQTQWSEFAQSDAFQIGTSEFPVQLTEKAIEMTKSALLETDGEDGEFLRVGIKGGGCAGFEYSLSFTNEVDEDDLVTLFEGVKVVTDSFSGSYLKGTDLDYVETLQGAGFKFINPNAKRTCGCGSSFSA